MVSKQLKKQTLIYILGRKNDILIPQRNGVGRGLGVQTLPPHWSVD